MVREVKPLATSLRERMTGISIYRILRQDGKVSIRFELLGLNQPSLILSHLSADKEVKETRCILGRDTEGAPRDTIRATCRAAGADEMKMARFDCCCG